MPLDGCTPEQRDTAAAMARLAGQVSDTAARIGDPLAANERYPELRRSRLFLEFQDRLERYEGRRMALRRELERMAAEP